MNNSKEVLELISNPQIKDVTDDIMEYLESGKFIEDRLADITESLNKERDNIVETCFENIGFPSIIYKACLNIRDTLVLDDVLLSEIENHDEMEKFKQGFTKHLTKLIKEVAKEELEANKTENKVKPNSGKEEKVIYNIRNVFINDWRKVTDTYTNVARNKFDDTMGSVVRASISCTLPGNSDLYSRCFFKTKYPNIDYKLNAIYPGPEILDSKNPVVMNEILYLGALSWLALCMFDKRIKKDKFTVLTGPTHDQLKLLSDMAKEVFTSEELLDELVHIQNKANDGSLIHLESALETAEDLKGVETKLIYGAMPIFIKMALMHLIKNRDNSQALLDKVASSQYKETGQKKWSDKRIASILVEPIAHSRLALNEFMVEHRENQFLKDINSALDTSIEGNDIMMTAAIYTSDLTHSAVDLHTSLSLMLNRMFKTEVPHAVDADCTHYLFRYLLEVYIRVSIYLACLDSQTLLEIIFLGVYTKLKAEELPIDPESEEAKMYAIEAIVSMSSYIESVGIGKLKFKPGRAALFEDIKIKPYLKSLDKECSLKYDNWMYNMKKQVPDRDAAVALRRDLVAIIEGIYDYANITLGLLHINPDGTSITENDPDKYNGVIGKFIDVMKRYFIKVSNIDRDKKIRLSKESLKSDVSRFISKIKEERKLKLEREALAAELKAKKAVIDQYINDGYEVTYNNDYIICVKGECTKIKFWDGDVPKDFIKTVDWLCPQPYKTLRLNKLNPGSITTIACGDTEIMIDSLLFKEPLEANSNIKSAESSRKFLAKAAEMRFFDLSKLTAASKLAVSEAKDLFDYARNVGIIAPVQKKLLPKGCSKLFTLSEIGWSIFNKLEETPLDFDPIKYDWTSEFVNAFNNICKGSSEITVTRSYILNMQDQISGKAVSPFGGLLVTKIKQ